MQDISRLTEETYYAHKVITRINSCVGNNDDDFCSASWYEFKPKEDKLEIEIEFKSRVSMAEILNELNNDFLFVDVSTTINPLIHKIEVKGCRYQWKKFIKDTQKLIDKESETMCQKLFKTIKVFTFIFILFFIIIIIYSSEEALINQQQWQRTNGKLITTTPEVMFLLETAFNQFLTLLKLK